MDISTFAIAMAYANNKKSDQNNLKIQIETTQSILETTGEDKTFYLLPENELDSLNKYNIYIYINSTWTKIGIITENLDNFLNE